MFRFVFLFILVTSAGGRDNWIATRCCLVDLDRQRSVQYMCECDRLKRKTHNAGDATFMYDGGIGSGVISLQKVVQNDLGH
jgi:hypothetical protein